MATSSTEQPENYRVLARRFRPQNLDQIVGQDAILETVKSALSTGRVPHALLFAGSRGVGKTTLARILARCLNCLEGVSAEPCGKCNMCTTILEGTNGDVHEIDAASHNLVDDIRELRDRVGFASMGGRYKVYILDEVHMLTKSAFNAFLKTLEEPPRGVIFILATTELQKVPETIRSRCQVLLFQRVDEEAIAKRLGSIAADEGLSVPEEVLHDIARSARGGMRDAETSLERILPVAERMGEAFGVDDGRRVLRRADLSRVIEVVGALLDGEAAPAMHLVSDLVSDGVDEREILGEVLEVLRGVMLMKVDGADTGLVTHAGEVRGQLSALAEITDLTRLDAMVHAGLLGRTRIRQSDDRRLVLEISVLRMAQAGTLPQLAELLDQVRAGGQLAGPPASTSVPKAKRQAAEPAPAALGATAGLKARLLEFCGQKHSMLGRTLELCAIGEPDGERVVRVAVESDRKLHRDRMASSGVQQDVRGMIEEILGHPVQLQVTLGGEAGSDPDPPQPQSKNKRAEPGPGVRKVLDRFDGKIINVDDESDRTRDR